MSVKSYKDTRFSLVMIDHQSGVMQLVHDYSPAEFRNSVIALAKLGKIFKLLTVLTTTYGVPTWNHQRVGLSGVCSRDREDGPQEPNHGGRHN
jgi:hypothetical protein